MKISFLVTYYNQEQYVKSSLDSILAISKPCDWEILVGDDGSSDGTVKLVESYIAADPQHISLHVMPRDTQKRYEAVRRASANRLNVLQKATGDLYMIMDGDDFYCDTEFLQEALDIFTAHSDASVAAFGYRTYTDGVYGDPVCAADQDAVTRIDKQTFIRTRYVPAGACVFDRNRALRQIERLKEVGYFDDNDILLNNLNDGEMYGIGRAVYAYRQTGGSIFNSMSTLEQSVLNMQGYDVDCRIMDPCWQKDLLQRNSYHFMVMYLWRNRIRNTLGDEKYQKYLNGCREMKQSVTADLMNWDALPTTKKREYRAIAWDFVRRHPRSAGKLYCKKLFEK